MRANLLLALAVLLVACEEPAEPPPRDSGAPAASAPEAPANLPSRRLERVAGAPIGASPADVRRALAEQGAQPQPGAAVASDDLHLSGGTYAGLPVDRWLLSFQEGGLRAGQIQMIAPASPDSAFGRVAAYLQDAYGAGEDAPPLPATTEAVGNQTPAERGRLWSFVNGLIRLRTNADTLTVHFSAESGG